MKLELGNVAHPSTGDPTVTYFTISDALDEERGEGKYVAGYEIGTNAVDVMRHLVQNPGMVTHLPGNEAILDMLGSWSLHSDHAPGFVALVDPGTRPVDEAEDFERFLAEYWGCARGVPEDVEHTHYTEHAGVVYGPGEAPAGE